MKIRQRAIFFMLFLCIFYSLRSENRICIPDGDAAVSVVYLSRILGVNLIYYDMKDCKSKRFISTAPDLSTIIRQYSEANRDILSIIFDESKKIIICANQKNTMKLKQLLDMKIDIMSTKALGGRLADKPVKITLSALLTDLPENIKNDIDKHIALNCPHTTLLECIEKVFARGEHSICHISFAVASDAPLVNELEGLMSSDNNIPTEVKNDLKKLLDTHVTIDDASKERTIELNFIPSFEIKEPGFLELLKRKRNMVERYDKISISQQLFFQDEFWLRKYLLSDPIVFLEALMEKNVFENAHDEFDANLIDLMPQLIVDDYNYFALSYLLNNFEKIKSERWMRLFISNCSSVDKSRLDGKSLGILFDLARKYGIERVYVDSAKWIGDDLPDGYDRWQNFKVSEVKLAHEENIGKFRLKYYKYETPVKIGGIPLKKMEEADYSTPEKAYFSSCSARTYEWDKISTYDKDTSEESYSLIDNWKLWHSNFNPFAEILYKIEITDRTSNQKIHPNLYLVVRLIFDHNKIVAIPTSLDGGKWKFFIKWTRIMSDLSKHIEREIAKLEYQFHKQ